MATRSASDGFAITTTNDEDGTTAAFSGTLAIDRFDQRLGTLRSVTYELDVQAEAVGGLLGDSFTSFGSALTFLAAGLKGNSLGLSAAVEIEGEGLPAIPLVPGVSTPVTYAVAGSSGQRSVPASDRFVGDGELSLEYEGVSGVSAFGGAFYGPQGGSFTNAITGLFTVEYTYRAAIRGTDGTDRLNGSREDDVLVGLGGADRIKGRAGSDAIYGGGGLDVLNGGGGNDVLTGDEKRDVFVFARGSGSDRITDWGNGDDRVDLRAFDLDFGDLRLRRAGDDVQLVLNSEAKVLFEDTARGELTEDDFLL